MGIDLTVLATEINTDPTGRGYAPHIVSGATNVIADLLNESLPSIVITRGSIERREFMIETDFNEVKSLGASERNVFGSLISSDAVPGKTVQEVSEFFGPATTTRTRLKNLETRDGSRGEELFGENVSVRSRDVALALGGP